MSTETADEKPYIPPELIRDVRIWLARGAVLPAVFGTFALLDGLTEEGLALIGRSIIATAFFAMALTLLAGSFAMRGDR